MSFCCERDDRRDLVREHEKWNGLDYVEVQSDQLTLTVVFLGKIPKELNQKSKNGTPYLQITGGTRVTDIQIVTVTPYPSADATIDDYLQITVDKYGDFSDYTLTITGIENIDPRYASACFNFKINCPSDLDCAPICNCQPPALPEPDINYLAKDYLSFRQLMLDRMAVIMPNWQETHAADMGIALVELLAYVGDYLSYYQDAVATESYLPTARQRISVRRHVRLVDYKLTEGCNSRAWLCLTATEDTSLPVSDVFFITGFNQALASTQTILYPASLAAIPSTAYEVFEPLMLEPATEIDIKAAYNEIHFYTWGRKECCVASGSTSADLLDNWTGEAIRALDLQVGDVLIFEEVIGPKTGNPADADPTRRCVVRLTSVNPGEDHVLTDPEGRPTPYVTVGWSVQDQLPFTFCVSTVGPAPLCAYLDNISVVRGNVILVDNGQTQPPQSLGSVPTLQTTTCCECADEPGDVQYVAGPFNPTLALTPITYAQPLPTGSASASALMVQDVTEALPEITLTSDPAEPWQIRYDLIESFANDWDYVVEIDDNSVAHLRFGDGTLGAQPTAGMSFSAVYRTGSGTAGNIGAESISRIVLKNEKLSGIDLTVRNPLPAVGGVDPEPLAEAKLLAPNVFLSQIERAVTAQDYQTIAERNASIQNAFCDIEWTGSWYEADVAIDPLGTETAPDSLLDQIDCYLEPFRMMGQDLRVVPAVYVPIKLTLGVCVLPDYEQAHVKVSLLSAFKAFFSPDNLTFGQGLYLSQIIATAQAVPGVQSVWAIAFQRLYESPNHEIANGVLPLATNEIAQLDNDPNYPEHGQLTLKLQGGI